MANAYPDPVVLPDPQTFATTAILTGGAGAALELARVSNYLLGNMGRNTVGQAWPDGHFTHQSTSFQEALRYKVPVPPGCTSLTVRVSAGASGGAAESGAVRVVSTEGADALNINITAAAEGYYSGTVTVDRDADGLEELVVSLSGNTRSTTPRILTLYSIGFEPEIDATPLPSTGKVGDAFPLGVTTILGADDAAPAWLYQALADNLQALRDDYPRAIGVWSAGNSALTGTGIHHVAFEQMFRWLALGRLPQIVERFNSPETATVHARMAGIADASSVNVNRAPDFAPQRSMSIEGTQTAATAAGVAAPSWQDGQAPVLLGELVGGIETLGVEFDLSRGGRPQVDSLTVVA
jgi:hypothetical protein